MSAVFACIAWWLGSSELHAWSAHELIQLWMLASFLLAGISAYMQHGCAIGILLPYCRLLL